MTIKLSKEYERLKSEYDKYTQRRADELGSLADSLERVDAEIERLDNLVNSLPRTMTEEEYLKSCRDLAEAKERKVFLENRYKLVESEVAMTEQEKKDFSRAVVNEHKCIMDEAEELVYKNLAPVLDKLEEAITKMKALEVISKDARITLLDERGCNVKPMAELLYELMCVGVNSYNDLAKEKKQPPFLVNGNVIFEEEKKSIRRMSKRIIKHFPYATNVSITDR